MATDSLYTQGFEVLDTSLISPLSFPGMRKNISVDDTNRLRNYIDSMRLGCLHFQAHMKDVQSLHPLWRFVEAHQMLRAISWHLERPFRQTMRMIGELIAKVGGPMVDVVQKYHEFEPVLKKTRDLLRDHEDTARKHGYQALKLPVKADKPPAKGGKPPAKGDKLPAKGDDECEAPIQPPFELFCEVLRRAQKDNTSSGIQLPQHLLKFVDGSPLVKGLSSANMANEDQAKSPGRPRVMTWSIAPDMAQNRVIIRCTRPAWEKFGPLFEITGSLRHKRTLRHKAYVASLLVEHRNIIEDGLRKSDMNLAGIRKEAAKKFEQKNADKPYQLADIMAGTYNAYTFTFVSRCYSCRALCGFNVFQPESEDEEDWLGKEFEQKSIRRSADSSGNMRWEVHNSAEAVVCAEIGNACACHDRDNPGHEQLDWIY